MGRRITEYVVIQMPSLIPGSKVPSKARVKLVVAKEGDRDGEGGFTRLSGLDLKPNGPSLGRVAMAAIRELKLKPPVIVEHEGVEVRWRGAAFHQRDDRQTAKELDTQWKLRDAQRILLKMNADALKLASAQLRPAFAMAGRADLRVGGELFETFREDFVRAYRELDEPVEISRYLDAYVHLVHARHLCGLPEVVLAETGRVMQDGNEEQVLKNAAWVEAALHVLLSRDSFFP